ncbi:MAG: ABC transporter ATP-binding protein [Cellulosilyticum sp.]|nr:ABC transporter ATP-binding protein [Cellulosilyticum sp.]
MLLEFKEVTGRGKKFKLDHISFALEPGYMMGLAGKNGAGKTTLVRYILDEHYPYEGDILLDGRNIKEDRKQTLDEIGFISEENVFFEQFSITQNVELMGDFYSRWDSVLFEQCLKEMGLYVGQKVGNLSRGEYMKFQLAFAMAHKPKLYILDEATAGMDPIFRKEFFKFLRQTIMDEKASILMITHIEEELEEKMDYVGIMEQGRLVEFKSVL